MAKKKQYIDIDSNNVQEPIHDIKSMANSIVSPDIKTAYLKLEENCKGLMDTVDHLLKEIESREEEISHLKKLLNNSINNPTSSLIEVNLSDEEFIADMQLRKLKDIAKTKQLTLDEIRMFDLLVKNKRLAQGNATTIDGNAKSVKQLGPTELLKLASKKIEGS